MLKAADDYLKKIDVVIKKCLEPFPIDIELVNKLKVGKFDHAAGRTEQCFADCVFNKAGFYLNGEINNEIVAVGLESVADKSKALASIAKCRNKRGSDACETSYLVFKCFKENL